MTTSARGALIGAWRALIEALPQGRAWQLPGLDVTLFGVSIPTLNAVWCHSRASPQDLLSTLDKLAQERLPHCVMLGPDTEPRLQHLVEAAGMDFEAQSPLMVLTDSQRLVAARERPELSIRALAPEEAPVHARVAAEGFGASVADFLGFMTPDVLRVSGMRCYVGEADGRPVTTGVGYTRDGSVGVFSIATPEALRSRGYGAAVTAEAVLDGLRSGAQWAYLMSSDLGLPVYEKLGFREVESWSCWIKP